MSEQVTESFEGMGLFASSLSLLVFPTMLVLPFLRKNAFILYIVSELSIIGTMWIFWVVSAALAIQKKQNFVLFGGCQFFVFEVGVQKCNQLLAIEGLTIVVFVLLMKYMLLLLTYSTTVYFRGDDQVWFRSVNELQVKMPALTHKSGDFEAKGYASPSIAMNTYPPSNPSIPPTQQMTYSSPVQHTAVYTPSATMPQV
ncbi:hypothetical protein BDZ97DRAFT_1063726 [Flammula alnicola]|nr:hypothetical protein BDZ97DRAFT_1063726 [Flammula alnicola]